MCPIKPVMVDRFGPIDAELISDSTFHPERGCSGAGTCLIHLAQFDQVPVGVSKKAPNLSTPVIGRS